MAANPNPAGMRPRPGMLDDNGWRSNAHINPLGESRGQAEQCNGSNKEKLLHNVAIPFQWNETFMCGKKVSCFPHLANRTRFWPLRLRIFATY